MNLFGLSQSQLSHAVARVMAAEPPASQARSRSPRRLQPPGPAMAPPPGLAPVAAVVSANLPADALPEGPLNSLEFLSSPRGTDELKRQLNTFLAEARAGKEAWEARFANMALDDPARYELGVFTYCYPCSQLVGLGHLEHEWPMFCAGRCEFHQLLEKMTTGCVAFTDQTRSVCMRPKGFVPFIMFWIVLRQGRIQAEAEPGSMTETFVWGPVALEAQIYFSCVPPPAKSPSCKRAIAIF